METKIHRGAIFYMTQSPLVTKDCYVYIPDGGLLVHEDKIEEVAPFNVLWDKYKGITIENHQDCLIMPGLIDAHIHFPQMGVVGMVGEKLLEWLNNFVFPAEKLFSDKTFAKMMAANFLNVLFQNGTTSCVAYGSVHSHSVDALFEEAQKQNMCLFAGKVLMDRNAPEYLVDKNISNDGLGIDDSRNLILRWDGKKRNHYVITPRFAITSSEHQLQSIEKLHREFPSVCIQTHLSENKNELKTVSNMFPKSKDYLAVYEKYNLVYDKTLLGHCVYLTEDECFRLQKHNAIVVHCPISNNFLGSGLMNLERLNRYGIKTVFATDVAGGNSFSMFHVMNEAYKVQLLQNYSLSVFEAFYRSTLHTAEVLGLQNEIGTFKPGAYADFIVVNPTSTPEQSLRKSILEKTDRWTIETLLAGILSFANSNPIQATYVAGDCKYRK